MKRVVNLRAFLVVLAFVVSSIIGCYLYTFQKAAGIVVLSVCAVILLIVLLTSFYRKKLLLTASIILSAVFAVTAVVTFFVNFYQTEPLDSNKLYSVMGKIEKVGGEQAPKIYLSQVKINKANIRYRICVYFKGDEDISHMKVGDVISFESKLKEKAYFDGGKVDSVAIASEVRYTASLSAKDITFHESKAAFKDKVKAKLHDFLVLGLGKQYGGIAYGMLTGDRYAIDSLTADYFGVSGLGHILAVSGLHIGFAASIILFILKKLKVRKLPSALITVSILFLYVAFTDFSPSGVRAFVLQSLYLVAAIKGKRPDSFNFLCFAAVVVLALNPFDLINVSFLMSFGCVYGIILFERPFRLFLRKLKLPDKLSRPLAMSLAVQIGSMPALIYFFHMIQLYSVIINLIMLPLVSILFTALMLCALLIPLFPLLAFLLYPVKFGLWILDFAAKAVSNLPYAKIIVYGSGIIFALYFLYFFISRFFMVRFKPLIASICAALCVVCVAVPSAPLPINNFIAPIGGAYDVESIVQVQGETFIVGDFSEIYLYDKLQTLKVTKVEAIVTGKLTEKVAKSIINFCKKFPTQVVALDDKDAKGMMLLEQNGIRVSLVKSYRYFEFMTYQDNFYAIQGSFGEVKVLFVPYEINYLEIKRHLLSNISLFRTACYNGGFEDRYFITDYVLNEQANFVFSESMIKGLLYDFTLGQVYQIK